MSRVPTVRKADLDRVLGALKDAGLSVAGIIVRPGGEVVITPGPAADALTLTSPYGDPDSLDAYRARKNGGHAA